MKRTAPRRRTDGEARLLVAACRLFAAGGFDGVSVRELTRAARVTRPVLYYHFGSKAGLHRAAVRRAAEGYGAALSRAARGAGSASERIRRLCSAHLARRRERVLLAASGVARFVDAVRGLVAEGIDAGEFAPCDPEEAALALVGSVEARFAGLAGGAIGPPGTRRLDGVLSFVLRRPAPASARKRSGATAHRGRR